MSVWIVPWAGARSTPAHGTIHTLINKNQARTRFLAGACRNIEKGPL
jgi:hypothetical protein